MIRPLAIALLSMVLPVLGDCGTPKSKLDNVSTKSQSVTAAKYNWLQFGGGSTHSGNNTSETTITPQNVSQLTQLFKINLPETIEGAPVVATNVSTSSGVHDVAFVTTRSGYIVALDAYSGQTLWSQQPSSTNITMSSPAIDPSLAFVYSNGLDGYIHKYTIGTGVEVTGGGWPELSTLKTQWEKGGTAITIATVGSTSYLYMGVGGYDGDGGDYEGHVTTVNLSTGAQTVFNAMCSNQAGVHFTATTPDCTAGNKSGVWAKSGVTFDPVTNRLYVGTGNGTFSPSAFLWGDSLLALNPDGTGVNNGPLDSYTPSNYQTLQNSDLDLGSTNTLILANNGSKYPHLAAQSGKDAMLRLINLDNMSGQGAPGQVAGEVYSTALPTGGEVQNPCATWINPADSSTWIFVVSPSNGMNALKLAVDGGGNPSLVPEWTQGGGGGGAHVANGVLYFAQNTNVQALNPTTGALLWNNTATGQIHWQTPVVVNGVMYLGDNGRQLTAFSLGTPPPPPQDSGSPPPPQDAGSSGVLSRTGWVATASSDGGGAPANALDGNEATRWSTGVPQANGEWFQVDMTAAQTFDQITLDAGGSVERLSAGLPGLRLERRRELRQPDRDGSGERPPGDGHLRRPDCALHQGRGDGLDLLLVVDRGAQRLQHRRAAAACAPAAGESLGHCKLQLVDRPHLERLADVGRHLQRISLDDLHVHPVGQQSSPERDYDAVLHGHQPDGEHDVLLLRRGAGRGGRRRVQRSQRAHVGRVHHGVRHGSDRLRWDRSLPLRRRRGLHRRGHDRPRQCHRRQRRHEPGADSGLPDRPHRQLQLHDLRVGGRIEPHHPTAFRRDVLLDRRIAHLRREHQRHSGAHELRHLCCRRREEQGHRPAVHRERELERVLSRFVHLGREQQPRVGDRDSVAPSCEARFAEGDSGEARERSERGDRQVPLDPSRRSPFPKRMFRG